MDVWIILTACLVGFSCTILGSFLMLRGMSMLSDTLSHAVLPGIVLGYALSGSRHSLWMVFLSFLFAFLAVFIVQRLSQIPYVKVDASIGLTYTWLFSLGLLLLSFFASYTDLDPDCVLFGEIQFAFLPPYWEIGNWRIPLSVLPILATSVLVIGWTIVYFQALNLLIFDAQLAQLKGLSLSYFHYSLMGLSALTAVTAFEHVGSVMVLGFFVLLPAAVFLVAKHLLQLLILSGLLVVAVSVLGYYWAIWLDVSITGSLMLMMSIAFGLAVILRFVILSKSPATYE